MIDGSPYGYMIELDGPDLVRDESSKQVLVQRMKKLPSKFFRSFVHNKDFEVSLAYESDLPPGVTSSTFAQYSVFGLSNATEKYSSRNLSSPIKASLHFSLSRSGVLSLDRADAVVEISEWVEVPKVNLTAENKTTTVNDTSLDGGSRNTSKENNGNLHTEGDNGNTTNESANEQGTVDHGMEKKLKKRTFRVPLKIIEKTRGPGTILSKESVEQAKKKLEALDKKDAERRTAELKNDVEGYIYSTREKLESSELESVSTSQERQSFNEKLEEGVTVPTCPGSHIRSIAVPVT